MSRLQDVAVDPVEGYRGLIDYFSFAQMENIEILFAKIGEIDPLGYAINPLWAALLELVEEA